MVHSDASRVVLQEVRGRLSLHLFCDGVFQMVRSVLGTERVRKITEHWPGRGFGKRYAA